MRVGLISDTHGLLRPEARAFLAGSDHIIHAGDICDASLLDALSQIAPVSAVRGNNDEGAWARHVPETRTLRFEGIDVFIVHDIADLGIDPVAAGLRVVIYGHSHEPRIEERDGVLYVNPGSAGPRRFKLPISAAELLIEGTRVEARLQML